MNKTLLLAATFALVATAFSQKAQAQHDIRAFLSEDGLDFIADEAPSFLPEVLYPPTISKSFACMDFEQRDTTINFSVDRLDISMPVEGRVRIELDFSASADGTLYADDLYACLGSATCQDSLDIQTASAAFEYELSVENGKARVLPISNEFNINPDDLRFELSGCGFTGTALTKAVDFTKGWLLNFMESKVIDMANEKLGPMLEDMLGGFQVEGSTGIAAYSAKLNELKLAEGGLALRIDADFNDRYEAAACIAEYDVAVPTDLTGEAPLLSGAGASHANLAVNMGMLNKALYTVWHRGFLCLTDAHVAALGVKIDLESVGVLLPGFPAGTEFSFELTMTDYPRVTPQLATGALSSELILELGGLVIDLHGDRPDGTRNTLHVEVDVAARAAIGIDPKTNAIMAQVLGAEITKMVMEDERKATGDGFDVARLTQLVHDHILPAVLEEMGPIPMTGPAFAFGDYAVILRKLSTSDAYLSAGIDLFRIPENDNNAPNTQIVDSPPNTSNPHTSFIRVDGSDPELPSELLQYQITVDGVERPLSFMREFKVGEMGKTATYEVSVAAVDMAGNVDPSPSKIDLVVDGISPHVGLTGQRTRSADEGPVNINWTMSDDSTPVEDLKVRVEIYELEDKSDALSAKLIETQELDRGATSTTVELAKVGGVYRVEIHAIDRGGNDSKVSLLLNIASTGGCSVGGKGAAGNAGLLLMALGLLVIRRRRGARS